MEIDVLLQPVTGNGYRASAAEPFGISANGTTRDEALRNLQLLLEDRASHGAEIVTLRVSFPRRALPPSPIWPDDDITRAWLEGVAQHRKHADGTPDSWDGPGGTAP